MHIEKLRKSNIKWWKHLMVFVLIIVTYVIGQLPLEFVLFSRKAQLNLSDEDFYKIMGDMDWTSLNIPENLFLLTILIPFLLLFLLFRFAIPKIFGIPFLSIITARKKFDFNRFFFSLVLWFSLAGLFMYIFMDRNHITVQFQIKDFAILLLISIILIPIQTAVEEIIFRGYFLQLCYAMTKHKMLSLGIVTLLFALMHLANPEFQNEFYKVFPVYLFFSFVFGILTVVDNGLEIPIGLHAGNNLFTALILSTSDGAMKTPSIFRTDVRHLIEIFPELLFSLSLISIALLYFRYRWNPRMLR